MERLSSLEMTFSIDRDILPLEAEAGSEAGVEDTGGSGGLSGASDLSLFADTCGSSFSLGSSTDLLWLISSFCFEACLLVEICDKFG